MREHLRIDTIKVFDEEAKALNLVMADIHTKNKSDGYREALKTYVKNKEVAKEIQAMSEELTATRKDMALLMEKMEDLYFLIRNQGVKA